MYIPYSPLYADVHTVQSAVGAERLDRQRSLVLRARVVIDVRRTRVRMRADVAGGASARLDPVDGRGRFAGGGARQASRGVVGGHLDARQLRRAAQELIGHRLVERATAEPVRSSTGRRGRTAEHFRSPVVESLEPDRRAVAAQRVRTKPQMLQRLEDAEKTGIERDDIVAVQPEIFHGGIERAQNGRREIVQRTVVQVETGRGEVAERPGDQLHVAIAVEEQMLQTHAAKRLVLDRLNKETNIFIESPKPISTSSSAADTKYRRAKCNLRLPCCNMLYATQLIYESFLRSIIRTFTH